MKKHNFHKITLKKLIRLVLLVLFVPLTGFSQDRKSEIVELGPGKVIERDIAGAEAHRYKIELQKDESLQIRVDQKDIDLVVRLLDAAGTLLVEMDGVNGKNGPEYLTFSIAEPGKYLIEITSLEAAVAPGKYSVFRAIDEKDRKTIRAEALFMEGYNIYDQSQVAMYSSALTKAREALSIFRELGDRSGEIRALNMSAAISHDLGEKPLHFKFLEDSLAIYRSLGEKQSEATVLASMANVTDDFGDPQKALEYYDRAYPIFEAAGDKQKMAAALTGISRIYSRQGDQKQALEYLEKALPLRLASGDIGGRAITLLNFGAAYTELGNHLKAVEFFKEALSLSRSVRDPRGEALALINLGNSYSFLGDRETGRDYLQKASLIGGKDIQASALTSIGNSFYRQGDNVKALAFLNYSLQIYREINYRDGEATALHYTGLVYLALGEYGKGLAYFNQALDIYTKTGAKNREADSLSGIGRVHADLDEHQKALDYYDRALELYRKTDNKTGRAFVLVNKSALYLDLGKPKLSLEYSGEALSIFRDKKNTRGEAYALSARGTACFRLGDRQPCLADLYESLSLYRAANDHVGEVINLYNLMFVWEALGNSRLAAFYGKQSINKYQEVRKMALTFDNESQKSLLRKFTFAYQSMAGLLLRGNQTGQAVKILNLYRDQKFFDLDRFPNTVPVPKIAYSLREQNFVDRYETAMDNVEEAVFRVGRELSTAAAQAKSETEFRGAVDTVSGVLEKAEIEFSNPTDEKDIVMSAPDVSDMQAALRELGVSTKQSAAAIYTVIDEDEFHTVLITPGTVSSFRNPIKAKELNKKILKFYALLQSPYYDPRILGKEIYDIMVTKALETELKKQKVQTLMWMQDGNLRYIPMAALSPDGKRYMAEIYQNVIFTRADVKRLTRRVTSSWNGYGFSSTQPFMVRSPEDKEKSVSFFSLIHGNEEMGIFRTKTSKSGSIAGDVLTDAQFTKRSFVEALKQKRPLVHISSHFRFYPGDSSFSFLLMGDGDIMTLAEMKEHKDLFEGVSLLTLSACETAAQFSDSRGREIDGFAELAQRLGAGAVIASLWQVNENSTSQFMKHFYKGLGSGKMNKADALRRAQLDLLYGQAQVTQIVPGYPQSLPAPAVKKSGPQHLAIGDVEIEEKYRATYKNDKKRPFAHPYYWSPFVLFGNWK